MHQAVALRVCPGLLLRESRRCTLAQLVVDERQDLLGGSQISKLDYDRIYVTSIMEAVLKNARQDARL